MNILVFGDSITQGFFDEKGGGWCNLLASHAMHETVYSDFKKEVIVFNLGVTGDNTENLLARFSNETKARVEANEETVIIIAIGANDSLCEVATNKNLIPLESFRKNLNLLVEKAKMYTGKIIFIGIAPVDEKLLNPMPWMTTHAYSNKYVQEYNDVLQKTCEENDATFIPLNDVYIPTDSVLIDGIHPNDVGHKLIFERVIGQLNQLNIL